nr:uncharacterized protein LOC117989496 [Maniola hyperantus]
MDSIQKTVEELSLHFHKTMAEFQLNLQSAIPATSPTSNIAAQFSSFRNFVLTALKTLQGQVEVLSQQIDQQETRSRKKILLVHGVPEAAKEDVPTVVVKALKDHLQIPELSAAAISRCHRMGRAGSDRPRAILIKFRELPVRNKIWYGKKSLKGTGITLAEFLTKSRHEAFMAARQQFGISKCWTKDGQVIVIGPDGKRHSITSKAELSLISAGNDSEEVTAAPIGPTVAASKPQISISQAQRSKRAIKK